MVRESLQVSWVRMIHAPASILSSRHARDPSASRKSAGLAVQFPVFQKGIGGCADINSTTNNWNQSAFIQSVYLSKFFFILKSIILLGNFDSMQIRSLINNNEKDLSNIYNSIEPLMDIIFFSTLVLSPQFIPICCV